MNDEALQQLRWKIEAMERFIKKYVLDPNDYPVDWDQERALKSIQGTALRDDPPDGWGNAKLAQFARGRVYGESRLAENALEHLHWIKDVLDKPDRWTTEGLEKRWGINGHV